MALHHHWHIDGSVDDTLRDTHLDHFRRCFHDLKYGDVDNLLHGALLNALLWDQSHNFNGLVHALRNVFNRHLRLAISTQPRKITILRTSVNFFPRVCKRHNVLSLITRIHVSVPSCGWPLPPSDRHRMLRHFVRGRQSLFTLPPSWHRTLRTNPLDLSALSVQQKQDHSFATHTNQRTLVKLFGLHASCILVSKSDRSYTTLFTGFASVVPVRAETSTRELTLHF